MSQMVPVTEAKARLTGLMRIAQDENVVLMRHGRPACVMVGVDRWDALMEQLDDLEDRLSIYAHDPPEPTVGLDKLVAEMGLAP
ncbi:MAG TPA: type II toxin-antitoxin system Phd/YefM family antitoxin [Dermatophilaceae bacterium]|nr:type II toxin-antitoxin system Phd/YefM family antitoxin [Dermatophilaceae bacterium]